MAELPNSPAVVSYGDGASQGVFNLALEFVDATTTEAYATWQAMPNPDDFHLEAKLTFNFNKILPAGTQWVMKRPDGTTIGSGSLTATSTSQDFFFDAVGAADGTYSLTIQGTRSLTTNLSISTADGGLVVIDNI